MVANKRYSQSHSSYLKDKINNLEPKATIRRGLTPSELVEKEVVQWMLNTLICSRSRDTKVSEMSEIYGLVKYLVAQAMEEKETWIQSAILKM